MSSPGNHEGLAATAIAPLFASSAATQEPIPAMWNEAELTRAKKWGEHLEPWR